MMEDPGSKASANCGERRVPVDSLQVGAFVRLEGVSWRDHPFFFNAFKIKNGEQLRVLQSLGLKEIVYIPEKSESLPEGAGDAVPPKAMADSDSAGDPALQEMWNEKRARAALARARRERLWRCEQEYARSMQQFASIMRDLRSGDPGAMERTVGVVDEMGQAFLGEKESVLNLISSVRSEEGPHYHAMNVAVLALMLAKEAGRDPAEMETLGMAALLHDIGKTRIEKRVLFKDLQALTRAERSWLEMHPRYAEEMLLDARGIPSMVSRVVVQHHERCDGSGYPKGLRVDRIHDLARILAVADEYDSRLNGAGRPVTPYQVLAYLFSREKATLGEDLLGCFIRCLGVYPPGTIVRLNDGSLGMVVSARKGSSLQPEVVLYDKQVPKGEAVILDLREHPELSIEGSVARDAVPDEALTYLSSSSRITYWGDMPKQA